VQTITFVDNSTVSYSNPVRQSLFVFEDSVSGSRKDNYKSIRAAENLKKIYPGVVSFDFGFDSSISHFFLILFELKLNLFKH
jgi:hypothetical protein